MDINTLNIINTFLICSLGIIIISLIISLNRKIDKLTKVWKNQYLNKLEYENQNNFSPIYYQNSLTDFVCELEDIETMMNKINSNCYQIIKLPVSKIKMKFQKKYIKLNENLNYKQNYDMNYIYQFVDKENNIYKLETMYYNNKYIFIDFIKINKK